MHCADRCSDEDRSFIFGLMNRTGPYATGEVTRLRGLLENTGSLDYARGKVVRYTNEAKGALESVPASRAKSLLGDLTEYLASRYS
jgi:geranylgeranyl pyrophosphate synthase